MPNRGVVGPNSRRPFGGGEELPIDADGAARGLQLGAVGALHGLYHVEDFEGIVVEQLPPSEHIGAPIISRFESGQPVRRGAGTEVGN